MRGQRAIDRRRGDALLDEVHERARGQRPRVARLLAVFVALRRPVEPIRFPVLLRRRARARRFAAAPAAQEPAQHVVGVRAREAQLAARAGEDALCVAKCGLVDEARVLARMQPSPYIMEPA